MTSGLGAIFCNSTRASQRDAIVTVNRSITWSELNQLVCSRRENFRALAGQRIGLVFFPSIATYAALFAVGQVGVDLFLMDGRLSVTEAAELGREFGLAAVVSVNKSSDDLECYSIDSHQSRSGASTVTILTSGSTGRPKAARHTWDSLCRPVRKSSVESQPRWLQSYRPNLYAGLQVMLQCFVNYGALIVPDEGSAPHSIVKFAADQGVQFISATPSYWRRLLISCDPQELRRMPLQQITLGGEVVDQAILDSLKQLFPAARMSHIYATTELGRCLAVTDGLAGFPATLLQGPSDGIELTIVDSELFAKSANAMACYDRGIPRVATEDGWFATGDLVDVVDGRVYFVGRKSEMINVGGNKVYPVEVERVIRTVPGVSDVRVFGRRSSLAGQLVACEIVAQSGHDVARLKNDVRHACNSSLAAHQLPRLIEFVDQIQLSEAQKIIRRVK